VIETQPHGAAAKRPAPALANSEGNNSDHAAGVAFSAQSEQRVTAGDLSYLVRLRARKDSVLNLYWDRALPRDDLFAVAFLDEDMHQAKDFVRSIL
jgi:hypothetical protein